MAWCGNNHLILNTNKMKDMIVDFRRTRNKPNTVSTLGEEVEVVEEYRYLGFTWTTDCIGNATLTLSTRREKTDCTSLESLHPSMSAPICLISFMFCLWSKKLKKLTSLSRHPPSFVQCQIIVCCCLHSRGFSVGLLVSQLVLPLFCLSLVCSCQ